MAKKSFLSLILLVFLILGCEAMEKKTDWLPTESAHELFPMSIVSGDIFYSDGKSIYIPSMAIFNQGWGSTGSVHIAGEDLKGIPEALNIQFFSYAENKFYEGDFPLDKELISKMFSEKQYSLKSLDYTDYHWVIVGCGVGGRVSVWLATHDRTIQVFYGKAEEVDLPWELVAKDSDMPRDEFVRLDMEETLSDDQKEELARRGIDPNYMDQFQQRYNWFLTFDSIKKPNFVDSIQFFNGESNFFFQPFQKKMSEQSWAAPEALSIHWYLNGKDKRASKLVFNQDNIYDGFAKLSDQYPSEPIELYLKPDESKQGKTFIALLRKQIPDNQQNDNDTKYLEFQLTLDEVSTTGSVIRDVYVNMTEDTKITTGWEPIVSAEEDD